MAITQFEREILLCHVLKIERSKLFSHPERKLTRLEQELFDQLVKRRENHEPIAYIVNNQPFMGLDFYVDQNVLIPRPETELLVEEVIKSLAPSPQHLTPHTSQLTIVDIGTGSGCIAISLAKHLPSVKVIAIDSSLAALEIAKKNAKANGVADRVEFRLGNMFEPLNVGAALVAARTKRTGTSPVPTSLSQKVDLIVSNPPYIPTAEIDKLEPGVRDFEPHSALDGGPDGLKYVRQLISEAPSHLTTQLPNHLFIEISYNQSNKLKKLDNFTFIKDYNGYDRILVC